MKILENLQALVTIGYLIMVLLGITFTGAKYSHFGINIFAYSDALDFLIAPFKDIRIFFYTIIPLIFTYIFFKFDTVIKTKFPRFYSLMYFGLDTKNWFRKAWVIQWIIIIFVYVVISSSIYGSKFKNDFDAAAKNVIIEFQSQNHISGKLIGSNPNFIFLQDSIDRTLIIPVNSTVRFIKVQNKNLSTQK